MNTRNYGWFGLHTFVHQYELALKTTLCSLTYLFTIQRSPFIGFRVNIKYGNQITLFDYN
jgi:hypothetical protein